MFSTPTRLRGRRVRAPPRPKRSSMLRHARLPQRTVQESCLCR
ncbi:hypothetical protein NSERUTF1_1107 [Nocardia seriolae]|nr:hypothetical protein NSERUTF1_1107 [Nocardia seriolae]